MRLEGWLQGMDSRPSFETRVSATQERRRYALLRMRVYPRSEARLGQENQYLTRFLLLAFETHWRSRGFQLPS